MERKQLYSQYYKLSSYLLIVIASAVLFTCKAQKKAASGSGSTSPDTILEVIKEVFVPEPQLSEDDSLNLKIGQMIMIGVDNAKFVSKKDSILSEIAKNKVGGIILFEKNVNDTNSYQMMKNLVDSLQSKAKVPLFISIDEEGGKVHRLKEKYGFVKMPSAMYLGKIDNIDSTYFYNNQLAKQLYALGINMNYAPSLDMAMNKKNPVIYKLWRSFSDDPAITTKHATAAIKAHQLNNVATVIKHFPGHGSSNTDSHKGLTDVTNTWKPIELQPFASLIASNTCDAVMTAHIVNCQLDKSCLPATLSQKVITGLLRDSLKFKGVVVSDDMQMYAISKNYGQEKAVALCINAGVDILLFGNNLIASQQQSATKLHAMIKAMVLDGCISKERISQSYQRIKTLKTKIGLLKK